MPLYEYQCEKCEEVSEFRMKMSDPDPKTCPKCGSEPLRKLMSSTAFQLKGGGWYSEGYDGQSNKKSGDSKKSSSQKSDSKATANTSDS